VRDLERVLKAAADPTRTRILKLLARNGLCVCQVQAVLGLAPSTVSKHLSLLESAGLVTNRRNGKWIEYTLAAEARNPYTRPVLALLDAGLDRDPVIAADRRRLRVVLRVPLDEICSLSMPPASDARRTGRRTGRPPRTSPGRQVRKEAGRA
jgi:ArsR family transcriptional regulator